MPKILLVDANKCVGCRVCELVCSAKHFKTFKRSLSGISCIKFDEVSRDIPVVCQQCEKPACEIVCSAGAIYRDEELGALIVDYEKCVGCKKCVSACPFGAIFFDEEQKKPIKCDFCDGDPECLKICPSEAISYEEAEKAGLKKRREIVKELPELMKLVENPPVSDFTDKK